TRAPNAGVTGAMSSFTWGTAAI
ncbi:MAG: hypothetical protein JWN96_3640, partial [Mycobacterium sp.]|nr:hypothetical protein [Mycobacterium sp.]